MVRSGAVREEREAELRRGWREPLLELLWLPRATGLRPRLRALNPGPVLLQGRPLTPLRMEKLMLGEGAKGCATREVVAWRGGFTHNHNLVLSLLYNPSWAHQTLTTMFLQLHSFLHIHILSILLLI